MMKRTGFISTAFLLLGISTVANASSGMTCADYYQDQANGNALSAWSNHPVTFAEMGVLGVRDFAVEFFMTVATLTVGTDDVIRWGNKDWVANFNTGRLKIA